MKLILIAALNKKRVIGKEGKIPWHIPEDLKRFKHLTLGYPVVMGRKTFESIGKILPERRNIVITSQQSFPVEHYSSIETVFKMLEGEEKVFIIGGGDIFGQTIDKADELFLTIVDNDEEGDTLFPAYEDLFTLKNVENHSGFSILHYRRET